MQKLVLIFIVLILAFGDTRNSLKEIDHKGKIKEQNISIKELVSQFVKILKGKINIPSTKVNIFFIFCSKRTTKF